IWFSSKDQGIYCYDQQKKKIIEKLSDSTTGLQTSNIQGIATDDQDYLWIATQDGRLLRYNSILKTSQPFFEGYFSADLEILNIIWFNKRLWIITHRSIYKFDPHIRSIYEYSTKDGIDVKMFTQQSFTKKINEHTIYFAGNNGIL